MSLDKWYCATVVKVPVRFFEAKILVRWLNVFVLKKALANDIFQ
jgi:hypothetical protein